MALWVKNAEPKMVPLLYPFLLHCRDHDPEQKEVFIWGLWLQREHPEQWHPGSRWPEKAAEGSHLQMQMQGRGRTASEARPTLRCMLFCKAVLPLQTAPPTGDQVFNYLSLWEHFSCELPHTHPHPTPHPPWALPLDTPPLQEQKADFP